MKSLSIIKRGRVGLLALALAVAQAAHLDSAQAANGTWTNLNGGSWANAANWSGGAIATGSGFTADFSTLTLPADLTVTLDGANTIGNLNFGDVGSTYNAYLNTGSGDPLTLAGTPVITVNNDTANIGLALAGTVGFTKAGPGLLVLSGANTYAGNTAVSAGTLAIGSVTLAADLSASSQTNSITIAAGAVVQSSGVLSMNAGSSNPDIAVSGAGVLQLTGTANSAASPDLSFNPNDVVGSTANWGARIATTLNLGNVQRYVWGRTDHSGVGEYGVFEGDCQFGGAITGSGGLTFVAQDSYTGSSPMETPFCLNATNTFTGPVQIQRGSVYLGTNNAFPAGNVLQFNVAAGNNGKFFLWGHNTTVSDLSSTGAGNAVIANGNRTPSTIPAATLTIVQNNSEIYTGAIVDTNIEYSASSKSGSTTLLNVIKNGPATLTLMGTNKFTGNLTVNAGTLNLYPAPGSVVGAVLVTNGATLGCSGNINTNVTVANGSSFTAIGGTGSGISALKSCVLGSVATDAMTINYLGYGSVPSLNVTNVNGVTNNGTVTINLTGELPATVPAVYNLISYKGAIEGAGTFVLGSLPDLAVAYLTNNPSASAIQLVVSNVTLPTVTWVGSPLNNWDQLGGNEWAATTNGAPASYQDGDVVTFDDTAANFQVNLAATVAPISVLVTNNANNYVISGNGQIAGYTGLLKAGGGSLTLATTNTYFGPTTISGGTLVLGTPAAIPSGTSAGNVTVNGTLDVGGFSPALNNLSGAGVVDNVSAGGSPVLTVSNSAAGLFAGAIQNSSGAMELSLIGSGTYTLTGNNTYSGGTLINSGVLQVGNGGNTGTLGAGPVLDLTSLVLDRSDTNTLPNNISGSGSLQQNGAGTVILPGNLTYTGPTLVNAGTLLFPKDVTFDTGTGTTLTIASNAVAEMGFELFLNANGISTANDVSGAGTVRLVGNINNVEAYADIIFGANNNGITTANYGVRLASGLDVGTTNRLIWAYSSRDDVATYGLTGCDSQFAGPISGTALVQLLGQNSWKGVNTMEDQFAFTASNSFTGPLEVTRGSVYVGNSNAFNGNVLILDPAASVNSRFFLYGFNASVSDLQSGGYGATVIANGNNLSSTNVGPATLTVTENHPTTFAGNVADWYTEYTAPVTGPLPPTLSLVKNGQAALTLAGNNTYSGTTTINAGKLYLNNSSTGGGMVTVNTNATLGGSGVLDSAVTVHSGGTIEAGSGAGYGDLQMGGLTLGVNTGDWAVLNLTPSAILDVTNNNGLVLNGGPGSVTINLGGDIAAAGTVPLISYTGVLGGSGFAAFQLGSLPPGVTGYLSNDTANASVDFVATLVTTPRWTGAVSSEWSINVLGLPKNWVLNSDGVTPVDYVDGENAIFDDTAVNPAVTISVANVSPASVTINNTAENYVISGSFGITGAASLTKQGTGQILLDTVNTYSGNTVISAGTLTVGVAGAIPGGAGVGNVAVNGTLDVAGFSPAINNLSGAGILDDLAAGGSPVVTVNESTGTLFSGAIQNTSGSLGLTLAGNGTLTLSGVSTYSGPTLVSDGTLVVNGTLGATTVTVQNGAALGGSGGVNGFATLNPGAALNLTANAPLAVHALTLNGTVTVNVSGSVSATNSATYVLLNYNAINATNLFQLAPVPGIFNSGMTATLNATTNQLKLVIAPTKPTGTYADIRHIVFFTQENRSFDHYFGSLHGVHGFSDHVTLTLTNGNSVFYQPSGPSGSYSSYELPFHTTIQSIADLSHSWSDAHQELDNGWHDQWVPAKSAETMAYYERSELPYHYALADAFTVCDEFHCCALTSTDPNRLYIFTGMIDPSDTGGGPVTDNTEPSAGWGTNWITYAQCLQKAGVSWKVYQASDNYDDNALAWMAAFKQAPAGSALYNNGMADVSNLTNGFAADVSNNVLPSVSWIVGPDYGSEHPSYEPGVGGNILQNLLNALAANPAVYNNTVFIYNIDEGDGFFDHAVPILPPAGTTNEFVSGAPIGLGERVPCIIISPWTCGGYVCSQVFDHTSVNRLIEKWTGVINPNISAWRRQVCGDLTSAFDFAHPNTNFPAAILNAAAETVNYSTAGTTATPPTQQTVPVQEPGTLIARPLPYQPNAWAVLDALGNCHIIMTNSGSVSMHFAVYPNAYSTILPTPFDVLPTNSLTGAFSTTAAGGNYDFSCYSANGFLRRFAGNQATDGGQIDSASYLNPFTDGFEISLANACNSNVVFSVTNGWFANSLATYTVPANSTNIVFLDASTNNGWYDLTVTANSDPLFLRRFAGHIETNAAPAAILSSENPSGFNDNVSFTATFVGFGTPSGNVQFLTNGVALGAPITLTNGMAAIATALLPRTNNCVTVAYSGDAYNPPATNSLTQVVLDHPPVPALVVYQRAADLPLNILISDLLTNVTDVDGDPITLVGVGTDGLNLLTTNGMTLATNSNYIIYNNTVTPNVNDSFEYTVSDGQGGISLGTVLIVVDTNVIVQTNVSLIVSTTNAVVNFFGVPGAQYEIDRSTNLTPGAGLGWVPISTNVAPVSGIIQVNDSFQNLGIQVPPTPPAAYYRLRPNP